MSKRRILYVHPSNELYGADRSLLRVVENLSRDQYEPYVVVPNDIDYAGLLTESLTRIGVEHTALKLGVLRRMYQSPKGLMLLGVRTIVSALLLVRVIRQHKIDLVHTNSTAVISGALAARMTRIPHIWHVREITTNPPWFGRIIAHLLFYLADHVVAVSSPVAQHLTSSSPALVQKLSVIHNGIDPTPFLAVPPEQREVIRSVWGIPGDSLVVGAVGRISKWKGQAFLIDAMASVHQRWPNAQLILVGGDVPGDNEHRALIAAQIDRLGLAEVVQIYGFSENIADIMAGFDIFVLPSINPDPFPTVVLEAMAAGLPVVATAHGGPLEQLVHGKTGFLVSPQNANDMANAITFLLGSEKARQLLGEAGKARLLKHFSVQHHISAIATLYHQVLDRHSPPAGH